MSRLFCNTEELVLASGSPRRRAYFEDLGLVFRVVPADIEERIGPNESPVAYVRRLAREKGEEVGEANPQSWIVAADTVVCSDGLVLEKPADPEQAVTMLMHLSGREHLVHTGICLFRAQQEVCTVRTVTTRVVFWSFDEEVARAYVESGEPLDKAGSYGIQGRGAFLVREVHGSYSNVVGLPLVELLELLQLHRVVAP